VVHIGVQELVSSGFGVLIPGQSLVRAQDRFCSLSKEHSLQSVQVQVSVVQGVVQLSSVTGGVVETRGQSVAISQFLVFIPSILQSLHSSQFQVSSKQNGPLPEGGLHDVLTQASGSEQSNFIQP